MRRLRKLLFANLVVALAAAAASSGPIHNDACQICTQVQDCYFCCKCFGGTPMSCAKSCAM